MNLDQIKKKAADFIGGLKKIPRKALLIPPDGTRAHSGAGMLTRLFFEMLEAEGCFCEILPALGTHRPMSQAELEEFFGGPLLTGEPVPQASIGGGHGFIGEQEPPTPRGSARSEIPAERFLVHNWRTDTVTLGYVPADYMRALSDGRFRADVPVEVNRRLVEGGYELILSIGQVVPHEVVGMANYTKNILVGCGGATMINTSHMLSVYSGYEDYLGVDHAPVRKLFDYAQENFLDDLPLTYVLTVTAQRGGKTEMDGLFISRDRSGFDAAVALSQRLNVTAVTPAAQTGVAYLDPGEFRTAWLCNKAVYRLRKALAPGARLIVLAPGFERFGEDDENDRLIRRYGYAGRDRILSLLDTEPDLAANLSAAAHLIQGSADGKFSVVYCTKPEYEKEIRAVGYDWDDIDVNMECYGKLKEGWNENGTVYYVSNPALGVWMTP